MYCRKCGSALKAEDRFCLNCGTPVAAGPAAAAEGHADNGSSGENPFSAVIKRYISYCRNNVLFCGGQVCFLKSKMICIFGMLLTILTQYKDIVTLKQHGSYSARFYYAELLLEFNSPAISYFYRASLISAYGALILMIVNFTEYRYPSKKVVLPLVAPAILLTLWDAFVLLISLLGISSISSSDIREFGVGLSAVFMILFAAEAAYVVYLCRLWKKFNKKEKNSKFRPSVEITVNGQNVKLVSSPSLTDDVDERCFINEKNGEVFRSISTISSKQVERIYDKVVFNIADGFGEELGIWKCASCGRTNDLNTANCSKCYSQRVI